MEDVKSAKEDHKRTWMGRRDPCSCMSRKIDSLPIKAKVCCLKCSATNLATSDPLLGPPSPDSEQLSPTDGYFNSRQHSWNQYTEVTVTEQQSVESEEAERFHPSHLAPLLPEAAWASDTDLMQSEENPLLRDHSPPPEYDRVNPINTTQRTAVENQNNRGSAPMFGIPKVFVTHAPEFQSLSIHIDNQHWDRLLNLRSKFGRREGRHGQLHNSCLRLFNAGHVIIGFALFILVALVTIARTGAFGWAPACLTKDFISRDYQIQTLDQFDFSDTNNQNSGLPRDFSGSMHILSGPTGQAVDLNISIRSIASDLHGGKTGADWRPLSLISCAEVALYFRPGLEISRLRIDSNNLRLVLSSNLVVTESTIIALRRGNLVSRGFDSSRQTYIDVRNSPVRGTFGLRDVLSIKSRSGSVSVDINPKAVLKGQPRPAVLDIKTRSGVVNIKYPGNNADIPDREYRSSISSRSGSVSGKILHGKETTIDIRSGSLNAQILPYGVGETSFLTTKLESGSSSIELLRPYGQHENPLTRLSSSHSARSGHLQLRYPDEWEGKIYAEARSGNIGLSGRDVEIIHQRTAGGHKYIQGQKGHGRSKLKVDIRSGSINANIGY